MVNVYKYLDYREYLRDLYAHLKETKPQFSFRFFSRQAGFRSPNYLKMVMDGQRNLSQTSVIKFKSALGLNKDEGDFFENLVHYTQAKTLKEKNHYFEKVALCKGYIETNQLEKEAYEAFSKWYHVAIREMIHMKGFREDPTWIACHLKPNITVREAQQALDTLLELGLIERKNGKLVQAQGNLVTEDEVASIAAYNFQKTVIQKAGEALDNVPWKLRDISSLTIAVTEEKIPAVKKLVQNFRRQLHAFLQDERNTEAVYQVNLQLFPLTERPERKRGKKK